MGWTKIPKEHHPIFEAALPRDERVTAMKMFGGVAGMVNGHMFSGLWADTVAVRLGEAEREVVLSREGGAPFDPMGRGKPMAEMVLLPASVMADGMRLRQWLEKAFTYTATLPPKKKKAPAKKASAKKASAKKAPSKKASAKKAPSKKASAKKAPSTKASAKKAASHKGSAKKAPARG